MHFTADVGKAELCLFDLDQFWKADVADAYDLTFRKGDLYRFTIYGCLTDESEKIMAIVNADILGDEFLPKVVEPEVSDATNTPKMLKPGEDDPEDIKLFDRDFKAFKPGIDLKDFPKQLINADEKERFRLLRGMHERFWHAPPMDMLRLLQAALLPKDIQLMGVKVARLCPDCRKFTPVLPKAQIKSKLATQFGEVVQTDLFFLGRQLHHSH